MLSLIGTTIKLTRGDTAKIQLELYQSNGSRYHPNVRDVIRFAAKKKYTDETVLIHKVIPNDSLVLQLDPVDTKDLQFGEYVYDVEITFENGDVDTFIATASLIIDKEVE